MRRATSLNGAWSLTYGLASQITQAEAMKFFVELFRQQKGIKQGILWWNIRDGWPIVSDAVVD